MAGQLGQHLVLADAALPRRHVDVALDGRAPHPAGRDLVDAHAVATDLVGQMSHRAGERAFGCRVPHLRHRGWRVMLRLSARSSIGRYLRSRRTWDLDHDLD